MNFHRSWFDLILKNRFTLKPFDFHSRSRYTLLRKMHAAATTKHSARFHRIIPRTARVSFYHATESFHRCKDRRRGFAATGIIRGGMASPAPIRRKITNFSCLANDLSWHASCRFPYRG